MEDKFEQFIKKLQSVSLTEAEKNTTRAALLSHIRAMQVAKPIPSPWSWILYARSLQVALLALVIVIGSGGTLSLAAQGTLPGDALYPIKTYVNEPLTRILTVHSPQEYASFETELLNVRLTEAETLDKEQKLNPELTQTIRQAVSEQSVKAETAVRIADAGDSSDNSTPKNIPLTLKSAAPVISATTTEPSTEPVATSTGIAMMTMATTAPEATSTSESITPINKEDATSSEDNDSNQKIHMQVESKFAAFSTTSNRGQGANTLQGVFAAHQNILQKLNLPEKDSEEENSDGK